MGPQIKTRFVQPEEESKQDTNFCNIWIVIKRDTMGEGWFWLEQEK